MSLIINKRAPEVAVNERWFDYSDGIRVKVRSIDYEPYQVAVGRARRIVHEFDAKAGGEPVAQDGERSFYKLQCVAMAAHIVADWDGVQEIQVDAEEGAEPVAAAYTQDRAAALLSQNTEFFVWVTTKASELAAEGKKQREETVGKPRRGGRGKGSGEAPPISAG